VSRHLAPEQFVDLLDGSIVERDVPHLRECDACRAQLASLTTTWQATASAGDVPEPSPLFWDHFSSRVHDAVAAESSAGGTTVSSTVAARRDAGWWYSPWRLAAVASALVIVLLAVLATGVGRGRNETVRGAEPVAVEQTAAAAAPPPIDEDASLALVADLASELDWDTAAELGLAPSGAAERVVVDLTDDERAELRRLLTEAIDSGA
jgi:hypothetical protein